MSDNYNISVVIPTYNRFEVLGRALESVFSQTYHPKEVIVIDDGSTDETSQIQNLFPKIKYYYQENSGVSSARNLGINKSTCNWIAFLDSDDEWHIDKLKQHVEFHKSSPDTLMSYTDEKWIRNGIDVKLSKKYQKFGGDIFAECLSHCIIAPSATVIHKSLLDEVGLFDESLEVCEDYDMWLRVALKNQIGLIDKKLIIKYGGADDQLSSKFWGMDRFRVQALEKLLDLELSKEKKDLIRETLVKKYRVLLKGAIKYDRMLQIKEYKIKIKRYEYDR
ncbi:glycosyltransferase family A protein [Sulfurimonas sp.]|uniref:glycosyltransferase family 2 protein n=1 Tax=Sulfurimonas sp. TaxID=2022749 RepID=UPI002611A710|nr:glycosyltransferase family A protein [Sulfurimonas sp.]MCW8895318.1 glycosyltransferase family 2 protein [Sulfurimonas sp.]